MAMTTIDEVITPAIAREYLKKNTDRNRKLSKKVVENYAATMREGNWYATHQGIAFNNKGELIDGQHRLKAIIEANVPVVMNVTRGVESENGFYAVDIGRKRTMADTINMSDEILPEICRSRDAQETVKAFMRYAMKIKQHPIFTDARVMTDYIERHSGELRLIAALNGRTGKRLNATLRAAMLLALYRGESYAAIEAFAICFAKLVTDTSGNYNNKAALALRDETKRDNKHTLEWFHTNENALYCFIHNIRRGELTPNERWQTKVEDM